MASVSKNVYIDKLDEQMQQNISQHNQNEAIDIKSSTYIDFNKKNNKDDPKFEVGDHVRISKIKYFCKQLRSKLV